MTAQTDPQALARAAAAFIPVAFRILGQRVLTMIALLATVGLFVTAICLQTVLSLGIAGAFAGLVLWPVLLRDGRGPQE